MGAKNKGNGAFISVYTLGYLGTEPGYFGCTREKYPVIYPGTPQSTYHPPEYIPGYPQSIYPGTPKVHTRVPSEYIPGYLAEGITRVSPEYIPGYPPEYIPYQVP